MDQPTWIGRSLNNRYKIGALAGKGGMPAVYRAIGSSLTGFVISIQAAMDTAYRNAMAVLICYTFVIE